MSGFVPSFSSFPDLDSQEQRNKKEHKSRKDKDKGRSREEEHRHRRRSRSRSPSHERSHKRHKHSSQKGDKEILSSRFEDDDRIKAKQDRERKELEDDSALSREYFVDKRGDSLNIKYGGLHQGDVPKFRRAGRGKVLGLSSIWNIARGSGNKEVETRRRDRRKVPRYSDSKSIRLLAEAPQQHIKVPSIPKMDYGDFIPISRSRTHQNQDPQDSYRRITTEENQGSDSEASMSLSSNESSKDDDEEGQRTLTAEQESIKNIESILSRSPDDEDAWLRLLDLSIRSISPRSKRAMHARADISVSILERAINSHPNNKTSPRLRLLHVEFGSEFWPHERIDKEWNDVLSSFDAPSMVSWKRCTVWMAYLEWRIANNRTIDATIADGERAMKALQENKYEMVRVTILWRVAVFLREAGYFERAISLFQAQIEMSYFCPPSLLEQSLASKTDQLEEFWDAEFPRIGEEAAAGWMNWHASGQPSADSTDSKHLPPKIANISDPYQLWYYRENTSDHLGKLPTRSFDSDDGDPFSTILFSDIKPFISDLRTEKAKTYLRSAFLAFLGLNVPEIRLNDFFDEKLTERHSLFNDGWMMSGRGGWVDNPDCLFPPVENDRLIMWESHAGTTVAVEQTGKPSFGPVKEWLRDSSLLDGFGISCEKRLWERSDMNGLDADYISRFFAQIEGVVSNEKWSSISNAFEAALDTKRAVRASKIRLEGNRSSIILWNDHAKLERIRGKIAEANKIYSMALILGVELSSKMGLTADAVEYFWLQDNRIQAERILADACGIKGPFQGTNLLRARKALESSISSSLQSSYTWEASIRLRFFLDFSASTLETAISTVISSLANVPTSEPAHESLTTWLCLTIFQLSQLPGIIVPQSTLANQVSAALKSHHESTILLGLFLECERGRGIWGKVRSLLDDDDSFMSTVLLSPKSLSRIAWEVWAEGWGYGPWEKERVRAKLGLATRMRGYVKKQHLKKTFDKGGYRSRRSVVLWRIYLVFELRVKDMGRAKSVLYRALGQCPWVKEFYLMAFGPLRSTFQARELNELLGAMAERGIRMRDDLEAHLEGWMDPNTETYDPNDPNAGDMELETLLHDREQAKPY